MITPEIAEVHNTFRNIISSLEEDLYRYTTALPTISIKELTNSKKYTFSFTPGSYISFEVFRVKNSRSRIRGQVSHTSLTVNLNLESGAIIFGDDAEVAHWESFANSAKMVGDAATKVQESLIELNKSIFEHTGNKHYTENFTISTPTTYKEARRNNKSRISEDIEEEILNIISLPYAPHARFFSSESVDEQWFYMREILDAFPIWNIEDKHLSEPCKIIEINENMLLYSASQNHLRGVMLGDANSITHPQKNRLILKLNDGEVITLTADISN